MFKTQNLFHHSSAEHSCAFNTVLLAFNVIKIHKIGEHSKCMLEWTLQITTSGSPLSWLPSPFVCSSVSLSYSEVGRWMTCVKPVLEFKMHFLTAVCSSCLMITHVNWCGMEWVGRKQLVHTVTCEKWCSRSLYMVLTTFGLGWCFLCTCWFISISLINKSIPKEDVSLEILTVNRLPCWKEWTSCY